MDEGREFPAPGVAWEILGGSVGEAEPPVYRVRDRKNPEVVLETTHLIDVVTFSGSVLEH